MPCKNYEKELWEWWIQQKLKTKLACILEADESTRNAYWKFDLQHYNLVHKFIPMSQAVKNSCSESSGGQ